MDIREEMIAQINTKEEVDIGIEMENKDKMERIFREEVKEGSTNHPKK